MNVRSYFAHDLFQGKTVFITGGGSGINLGIARNFAAVGADLGILGRSQDTLNAAAVELRALGARVSTHAADVRDYPALEKAMRDAREELGPIHTLICGAAGNFPLPAEQISPNGLRQWWTSICWAVFTPAGRRSSNSRKLGATSFSFPLAWRSCRMLFKPMSAPPRPVSTT